MTTKSLIDYLDPQDLRFLRKMNIQTTMGLLLESSPVLWELLGSPDFVQPLGKVPESTQERSALSSSSGPSKAGGLPESGSRMNKPDMVNAPPHYTRLNPQPIEVIEAWDLNFFRGSALKYIARAGFKEGQDTVVDLEKAISFLKREVERLKVTK